MNYRLILQNTVSTSANLLVNKKLLSIFGLEVATFIAFLVDKEKYLTEKEMISSGSDFYCTNQDISLYTGITLDRISKIKSICEENGLVKTVIKGTKSSISPKTYYSLNHEKLVHILSLDAEISTLAQERVLNIFKEDLSKDNLETRNISQLRLLCKKFSISYTGNTLKRELIQKLIENIEFLQWLDNPSTSGWKNHQLVDGKTDHQWTEFPSQKKSNIKKSNKKNQNTIEDEFSDFFKEVGIEYHKTNQESIKKLLSASRACTQEKKISEVKQYLKETYENIMTSSNIKDPAGLFTAKLKKGERQVNSFSYPEKDNSTVKTKNEKLFSSLSPEKQSEITALAYEDYIKESGVNSPLLKVAFNNGKNYLIGEFLKKNPKLLISS